MWQGAAGGSARRRQAPKWKSQRQTLASARSQWRARCRSWCARLQGRIQLRRCLRQLVGQPVEKWRQRAACRGREQATSLRHG